jgi:ribonucleotide reductase alpha subunit
MIHAMSIDQGGKRKGSFAIYIETWHADVLILDLKRIQEKKRCVHGFILCNVDF